jgi:hypothetical protein
MGFKSHIWKKKNKKTGSRPGLAESPGFGRAVATAGLLLNLDRSNHRVDPPGQTEFNNTSLVNYFMSSFDKKKKKKYNLKK